MGTSQSKQSRPQLVSIVDQGGGSFTSYLYEQDSNGDLKLLGEVKSKSKSGLNVDLFDVELLKEFQGKTSMKLFNEEDGTFTDFSGIAKEHYQILSDILSRAWKKSLLCLLEECKMMDKNPEIICRYVRQTGKIRAYLFKEENSAKKDLYESVMTATLGPFYDFMLLSNADEQRLESESFFYGMGECDSRNTIGISVGSSSTQGFSEYTQKPLFDSELGAKPIRGNEAQGPDLIQAKFEAIFKEALPKDESIDEITLVILNAFGYALAKLTNSEGYEEFRKKVEDGVKISAVEFLDITEEFFKTQEVTSKNYYTASLLVGVARAISTFGRIKWLLLERKGKGVDGKKLKALPFNLGWILPFLREKLKSED